MVVLQRQQQRTGAVECRSYYRRRRRLKAGGRGGSEFSSKRAPLSLCPPPPPSSSSPPCALLLLPPVSLSVATGSVASWWFDLFLPGAGNPEEGRDCGVSPLITLVGLFFLLCVGLVSVNISFYTLENSFVSCSTFGQAMVKTRIVASRRLRAQVKKHQPSRRQSPFTPRLRELNSGDAPWEVCCNQSKLLSSWSPSSSHHQVKGSLCFYIDSVSLFLLSVCVRFCCCRRGAAVVDSMMRRGNHLRHKVDLVLEL